MAGAERAHGLPRSSGAHRALLRAMHTWGLWDVARKQVSEEKYPTTPWGRLGMHPYRATHSAGGGSWQQPSVEPALRTGGAQGHAPGTHVPGVPLRKAARPVGRGKGTLGWPEPPRSVAEPG